MVFIYMMPEIGKTLTVIEFSYLVKIIIELKLLIINWTIEIEKNLSFDLNVSMLIYKGKLSGPTETWVTKDPKNS